MFFRFEDWSGGAFFIALGLLGLFIYFIARLIKGLIKKSIDGPIFIIQILTILMSVTLFAKYLNYPFGDIPALIIIPLFAIGALVFLIRSKKKNLKLTVTSCLYLLLIIPLFFTDFYKIPRKYFIENSYGRYDPLRYISVTLPYKFKYSKTERLCNRALKLREISQFDKAIEILQEARILEPDNPEILFHLSNFYAREDSLEKAILLLDSAIKIDHLLWAGLFNNRGLLYYKLSENEKAIEDYSKAIELDPKNPIFYANLTLAYYYEKDFDKACESLSKSEQLGEDLSGQDLLISIKKKFCK